MVAVSSLVPAVALAARVTAKANVVALDGVSTFGARLFAWTVQPSGAASRTAGVNTGSEPSLRTATSTRTVSPPATTDTPPGNVGRPAVTCGTPGRPRASLTRNSAAPCAGDGGADRAGALGDLVGPRVLEGEPATAQARSTAL